MTSGPHPYAAEPIPPAAEAEIRDLLASGDLFRYTASSSGAARLEAEFAAFMDVPYALAVNSCSSAMFLALKALGLPPGSRVLIPAFTFAAVPSAVVHAGCEPVLVNVAENYRLDIEDFRLKLTAGAQAVLISHMRGHTSDMDAIQWLCEAQNVPLIEDAAHSLGTTWAGRRIGTIGQIGCFSFQSYKLVNAGEGGMFITHDPDVFARAVIMSGAYEHNWKKHPAVGSHCARWQNQLPLFNLRMNNLSAAVARAQIGAVQRRADKGLRNHDRLAAILNLSTQLKVPAALAKERRAPDSIQFNLIGFNEDATALSFQANARQRGVEVQIIGLSPDNARAFWNWSFIRLQEDLEPTRAVLQRACDLRLPIRLAKREIDEIGAALVEAAEAAIAEAGSVSGERAGRDARQAG